MGCLSCAQKKANAAAKKSSIPTVKMTQSQIKNQITVKKK